MRLVCRKKILYLLFIFVFILIIVLNPGGYGHSTYEFIGNEDILESLHEELAVNFTSSAIADCEYYDIIHDATTLSSRLVDGDLTEGHRIKEGGEYAPSPCKPKFSIAILVPYRDRAEQLRGFLVYMHTFLRNQRVHYRIYVIEQMDSGPFNRAKLLNIGAKAAMRAGYPCLVLHDVDLLPLRPANLYACTERPRHMSSCINKFRFILPYLESFSGAVAILSKQYKTVNGMSNEYYSWGGEDDDLYSRLKANNLEICRFGPATSQYHAVSHKVQHTRVKAKKLPEYTKERMATDGLNSLKYTEVATVSHPLFTHIMVDL